MNLLIIYYIILLLIELAKIVLSNTILTTIITGVFVFIVGQYYLEYIIKRNVEFAKLKQRISYNLVLYSHYIHSPIILKGQDMNEFPIPKYQEASKELRMLGSELASYENIITKNEEKRKIINETYHLLIGLSNGVIVDPSDTETKKDNREFYNIIKENLKKI